MNKKELRTHIGRKIKQLRNDKGITQKELGDLLGVKNNTISAYERGAISTDQDVLFKLSNILGVSIDDFFPSLNDEASSEYNFIPTAISAGLPITVDGLTTTDIQKISIPDVVMGKYAGNKNISITKINGDSMDNIMPDGSLIAVKPVSSLEDLKSGDIVVYARDGDYAVKRIHIRDDKLIFKPDSSNPAFYDDVINIDDNKDLKIKGKVVMYIVNLD